MKRIAQGLLEIGAVKINPDPNDAITFKSGIKSPVYCDNRLAYGAVQSGMKTQFREVLVSYFSYEVWQMLSEYDAGHGRDNEIVIVGVATGAIGWGFGVALNTDLPFAYVRAAAKDHGLGQQIEGYELKEGDKVIIIEDLISTGGSSLAAVEAVRAKGAEVIGMVAIMTYGWEKTQQAFNDAKVPLVTLTNYAELVEVGLELGKFTLEAAKLLNGWYKNPEAWGK